METNLACDADVKASLSVIGHKAQYQRTPQRYRGDVENSSRKAGRGVQETMPSGHGPLAAPSSANDWTKLATASMTGFIMLGVVNLDGRKGASRDRVGTSLYEGEGPPLAPRHRARNCSGYAQPEHRREFSRVATEWQHLN